MSSRSSLAGLGATRRRFLQHGLSAGALLLLHDSLGCAFRYVPGDDGLPRRYAAVVADMSLCTGCRTCEAACAGEQHAVQLDGKRLPGLANPHTANMRVRSFNPDVDVPATCALCPDSPCIASCPVAPDEATGRRALYRHPDTGAVTNDSERCYGCGRCAATCAEQRMGAIVFDPRSRRPQRMCTLCGGEPQCVRACPYQALSFQRGPIEAEFHGQPPEQVAQVLFQRWYGVTGGQP